MFDYQRYLAEVKSKGPMRDPDLSVFDQREIETVGSLAIELMGD